MLQSERGRKHAENELSDASNRINELTINITSLTGDKRRLEADYASMHNDLEQVQWIYFLLWVRDAYFEINVRSIDSRNSHFY